MNASDNQSSPSGDSNNDHSGIPYLEVGGRETAPILSSGTAAAEPAYTKTPHSAGVKGKWRIRRLDPIFYLITGCAALGLVGSLYALISQNNAYFDREFQQLQRETAALNARLAANDAMLAGPAPQAAPDTTLQAQVNTSLVPETTVTAATPESVTDNTSDTGAAAVRVGSESTQPMITAQVPEVSDTPDRHQSINADLGVLQAELNSLRAAVESQEQQIRDLRSQNQLLQQRAVGPVSANSETEVSLTAQPTPSVMPVPPKVEDKILTAAPEPAAPEPAVPESMIGAIDTDSLITRAYTAYQAQNYVEAARLYDRVVQLEPYHRSANLGLAASAQQAGDYALAERRFRHLLSVDPLDATAFSGLLNLASVNQAGAAVLEQELRQHVAQYGYPAALSAVMGNFCAQNSRWSDAETAFSTALQKDAGNADYLFNYAVVIDNLGRHRDAATFYARALDAARQSQYTFDANAARNRLQSLTERVKSAG